MAIITIEEPLGGVVAERSRLSIGLLLFVLATAAMLALSLAEVHNIDRDFHSSLQHNDLIGRWYGTRAVLRGQNPYSPAVTIEIKTLTRDVSAGFDYPAHLAVLLLPLAALPWKAAGVVYLLLVLPAFALSIWLCIRLLDLPVSKRELALIGLLALCSWPSVWGIRLLQPGLLTTACVFLACFLFSRGNGIASGALLALATTKPHLVLPLLTGLVVWACLRRRWSFLFSFLGTILALLALTELLVPGWFLEWAAAMRAYHGYCGRMPLEFLLGTAGNRVLALALVAAAMWRLLPLRRCAVPSAAFGYGVALLLALTVAINFTIPFMIYNDVLLLPGCVLLFSGTPSATAAQRLSRRFAQVWLAWSLLSVPAAMIARTVLSAPLSGDKLVFVNPLLGTAVTVFLLLHPPDLGREATASDLAARPA